MATTATVVATATATAKASRRRFRRVSARGPRCAGPSLFPGLRPARYGCGRPRSRSAPSARLTARSAPRTARPSGRPGSSSAVATARGAAERGDDDRGHLPVPVEPRMDEEGGIRAGGGRDVRRAPVPNDATQRCEEHRSEEQQPERPELGERLEIERVGVERAAELEWLPGLRPVVAERACARAEQRMRENLVVPSDVEVGRPRLGRAGACDCCPSTERQDDASPRGQRAACGGGRAVRQRYAGERTKPRRLRKREDREETPAGCGARDVPRGGCRTRAQQRLRRRARRPRHAASRRATAGLRSAITASPTPSARYDAVLWLNTSAAASSGRSRRRRAPTGAASRRDEPERKQEAEHGQDPDCVCVPERLVRGTARTRRSAVRSGGTARARR